MWSVTVYDIQLYNEQLFPDMALADLCTPVFFRICYWIKHWIQKYKFVLFVPGIMIENLVGWNQINDLQNWCLSLPSLALGINRIGQELVSSVSGNVCLSLFYILGTSNVISRLYSASPLRDQATSTITWYPTQSHYPNIEPTSPCPILILIM